METRKHHSAVSMAHDFFYLGVGELKSKSYASCNVSYDADGLRCFSYSTCIAKVIPRKGYHENDIDPHNPITGLTLTSSDYMSPTTCKHVSHVRGASPFDVVQVPFVRGGRDVSPDELARRILDNLNELSGRLNHADNRMEFIRLLDVRKEIVEKACSEWAKPFVNKKFAKYDAMRPELDRIAKELQKRNRVRAAAEAKRIRLDEARNEKIRTKWLVTRTGEDYLNFMRDVFGEPSEQCVMRPVERAVLRKAIIGNDYRVAYVWLEGDSVCTSKGISVPVREARVAMKAWAAGKDMRAVTVGNYSIVRYEGDIIQIGCHHIPRENMLALYEVVIGKKFPERKVA